MSELSEAINEMRTMREAYDELSAAAEAYNAGKTELAQNITAKGVEASASETLPELAEKVNAIAQESYTIQGGELYGAQISGSLQTPNYWDLYAVLMQLLSDGRLVQYGGILLAEYYRGYDSLALSGAGAGGAYVVSDKDENGDFIKYDTDIVHTWNTEFDGKGNRWVAYCFAEEYHDFQITDTNTSPRSVFIGRKVGTINCLTNTRITEFAYGLGAELNAIKSNGFTHKLAGSIIIKVNGDVNSIVTDASDVKSAYISGSAMKGPVIIAASDAFSSLILSGVKVASSDRAFGLFYGSNGVASIILNDIETLGSGLMGLSFTYWMGNVAQNIKLANLSDIYILNSENVSLCVGFSNPTTNVPRFKHVYFGYKTNDKTKSFILYTFGNQQDGNLIDDIELQDGWCKPIVVNVCNHLTEENMYAHILQRLKQDEPNCGSGVTITLGSANLARLTSEESQALLAELRGTYGYTFA